MITPVYRGRIDGKYLMVFCNFCGVEHIHGAAGLLREEIRDFEMAHRSSHCQSHIPYDRDDLRARRPDSYYIRIEPYEWFKGWYKDENGMSGTMICDNCKEEKPRTRAWQRFCSTECRVEFWRKVKEAGKEALAGLK